MRFSLVVCTRNRRDELVELFASLVRQRRADFEVIVVDQNADERLVPVVAQFADQFPLKHVRMTAKGASRARNLGLDNATADIIAFPDDDCRYLDGYLDAVDEIFMEDQSIGCITGFPTAITDKALDSDWRMDRMDLHLNTIINRCQEFTVVVRRQALGNVRYNEHLGVGAQTPWGAEEGPDFLIRLVQAGTRLVYFPRLLVYHPDKIGTVNRSTLSRALGYARGRGCLFRLYKFPPSIVIGNFLRPAAGCILHLLRCNPKRSAYYLVILLGTARGLFMSKAELADVRDAARPRMLFIEPIPMPQLPAEPLVSVLISNYNYARFIPAALDSLLAQTYSNWHAVVCDDGSTDNSVQVIQQYAAREPRIQLVTKSNGGQTSACNSCYSEAHGEIVCFLDADDVFDAGKIDKVVQSFRDNASAGACNHFSQVIDAHGRPQSVTMHRSLDSGWMANEAIRRGACVYVPTTSCMSLRREAAELLFPIPERQDRDLDGYLAMACQFLVPICVIHEQLSLYRIHGRNMGGLTEPTPERLRYELHLIELRTSNVKEFAKQRFGDRVASQIILEDNPQYIQAALKLLAIERADRRLPRALALIRRHPNAKWRAIWRVIFAAPERLSRRAVPWMHRSYKVKEAVHRLMGREKVATT